MAASVPCPSASGAKREDEQAAQQAADGGHDQQQPGVQLGVDGVGNPRRMGLAGRPLGLVARDAFQGVAHHQPGRRR